MSTYFDVVHHIAGRIRLRVSPRFLKQPLAKDAAKLTQQINAIRGIKQIRLNLAIGSVVIQYDPQIIQPNLWEQWLQDYNGETELNNLIKRWQAQIG